MIGSGSAGLIHAQIFASAVPGTKFVVFGDSSTKFLAAADAEQGITATFTDYRDAFRYRMVDAVVIAAPKALHREIAVAVAGARSHVVCEEPMAMDVAECDTTIEAARVHVANCGTPLRECLCELHAYWKTDVPRDCHQVPTSELADQIVPKLLTVSLVVNATGSGLGQGCALFVAHQRRRASRTRVRLGIHQLPRQSPLFSAWGHRRKLAARTLATAGSDSSTARRAPCPSCSTSKFPRVVPPCRELSRIAASTR